MQYITNDGHRQVGEIFLVMPDGVHVEQTLRGMGMPPIARIDHMHMRRDMLGNQVGGA